MNSLLAVLKYFALGMAIELLITQNGTALVSASLNERPVRKY